MSLAMSDSVKDVRTIELSETLHLENVARVEKAKKQDVVRLIHGHSAEQLPSALEGAERPLVWLDAHWSAGKTTRDDSGSDTPIVDELQALKTFGIVGVVAVDDMWCFDGKNGYPTIDELTKLIIKLWPQAKPTREDEVMWFTTA